jgi:phosphoinositide-3-kinase regulatory subunit 4
MITQMLSRQPGDRAKFDLILAKYRGTIFPEYFYTFLEEYVTSLAEPPAKKDEKGSFAQMSSPGPGNRMDRMLQEWDSISVQLEGTAGNEGIPGHTGVSVTIHTGALLNLQMGRHCYC